MRPTLREGEIPLKKRLALAVWSVSAFCALGLGSQLAFGAPDNQSAAKALVALDTEWSKAAVAKDTDRVVSFYAEDAVAYPPNEPISVGRAAARQVWGRYFSEPTFQISRKTTASGAEKSLGWTSGTYEDSYKGPDGKVVLEKGKYVCIWRKGADGKWKAIRDIWNSDGK